MTPEQIVATPLDQLPLAYPDASLDELRKIRKRAQCVLWQRRYRAQGRDTGKRNFWLGYMDGPPIGRCATEEHLKRNAIAGSVKLAAAIKRAGLVA